MEQEKKQAVALMRYSAIAPLITGTQEDYESLRAYFRTVSAKGIKAPDGSLRHYSPGTLEKWYLAYRKSGFDALLPTGRSDCGVSRKIDDDLREQIIYLKHHYPRMSAAAIYKQLQDNGSIRSGQLSESTVCRFINQLVLQERLTNNQDMRRYERPHINEVWCGDSSAGPYLKTSDGKKHRVFVIALIDDASRFILGADVFFNDTFVNLMSVMKSAVSKYGRPKVFNFDNGAAYKNRQMELLAARIGSVISYCRPYTPTQKAKIERWFRTLKDQWMASLDMRDFHTLEELRGSLLTYVRNYNQHSHSSLKGISPQERFFQEPELISRLPDELIESSFLLEIERRVSADSVIVIDQVEYEVDYRFPVLIRVLSDDEAILEMVDSNVQREQISPSEKAFAYRMKYDVLRRSVGRPKSGQIGYVYPKGKSPLQEIGAEAGDSQKQVQRYIRITYLIPELLKLLDEGILAFNPAVDLSFLSEEEQKELLNAMDATQSSPSISQAQRIKELSQSGKSEESS